jgi:UDP-N-acetyl-D-mannosaminuronate dehydrogenase
VIAGAGEPRRIAVVGQGYAGLPLYMLALQAGYETRWILDCRNRLTGPNVERL